MDIHSFIIDSVVFNSSLDNYMYLHFLKAHLLVFGIDYVILLWYSLCLPYNYFQLLLSGIVTLSIAANRLLKWAAARKTLEPDSTPPANLQKTAEVMKIKLLIEAADKLSRGKRQKC